MNNSSSSVVSIAILLNSWAFGADTGSHFIVLYIASQMTLPIALGNNITIGVALSLTNADPQLSRVQLSHACVDGLNLWLNSLPNKQMQVGGSTYNVNLVVKDDQANATLVRQYYTQMVSDPNIDFLVGGTNSDFGIIARQVVEAAGKCVTDQRLAATFLLETQKISGFFYQR